MKRSCALVLALCLMAAKPAAAGALSCGANGKPVAQRKIRLTARKLAKRSEPGFFRRTVQKVKASMPGKAALTRFTLTQGVSYGAYYAVGAMTGSLAACMFASYATFHLANWAADRMAPSTASNGAPKSTTRRVLEGLGDATLAATTTRLVFPLASQYVSRRLSSWISSGVTSGVSLTAKKVESQIVDGKPARTPQNN